MELTMATAGLALVLWTLVMWFWLYITRLPAMSKAGIDAGKIKRPQDLEPMAERPKWVADNYNHLHEQPILFYFLVFYAETQGLADEINIWLAWAYVGLRVLHSIWQSTVNYVPLRFVLFAGGSFVLMAIAGRAALQAFG